MWWICTYKQTNKSKFILIEASADSPSMQEKWEPEPVKLIWDLWIEERQQSTDIIHAVHLKRDERKKKTFLNLFYDLGDVHTSFLSFFLWAGPLLESREWPLHESSRSWSRNTPGMWFHTLTKKKQAEPMSYTSCIGLILRSGPLIFSSLTSLWFRCSRVGLWWCSLCEAGWCGSLCCTWYKSKRAERVLAFRKQLIS